MIEYTMSQFANKDDMIFAMRAEITTLRARVKELEIGGWISVKDRLPSDDCRVLAATWVMFNGEQMVEISSFNSGCVYFSDKVTHWQPLPNPPKE